VRTMLEQYRQENVLVPSSLIRPEPLNIVQDVEEKRLIIVNAITFKKAPRPKQITRTIRNILESEIRGSVEFDLDDERDSLSIVFSNIDVESEEQINRAVFWYARLFSRLTISFPQYTYQEYCRYGIRINSEVIIIITRSINEIRDVLKHEALTMVYPFMTLPDEFGRYYISKVGMDYLYFPGLSIASEKKNIYVVYEPIEDEEGIKLVPLDIRDYARSLLNELRKMVGGSRIEIISRAFSAINNIIEKPYMLLKVIDDLKSIADSLERLYIRKSRLTPIGRSKVTFPHTEEKITSKENRVMEKVLYKILGFIEILDVIKHMDEKLYEVYTYRALARIVSGAGIAFTGRIYAEKVRKLQKFGAGNALYLSAEEVRDFLAGMNYVKTIFIEDSTGKKRIIIEPYED